MSQVDRPVLVVGASGFVGGHLARALLADGHAVRCLARDPARVQDLAEAGCRVARGDVLDAASVEAALGSVRAVYVCLHTLSPQRANTSGQDFMGVERTGLEIIVEACRAHGVRRLVHLTSLGVAPDAPSAWLRERWAAEQFLLGSGLDVTVLRPGMVVGRGGTGFEMVLRGARAPVAITLGSGQQRTRTIAVEDLAHYLVGVLEDPRSFGQCYDVGSSDVLTTDQMIDTAAERLGRRHPVKVHLPRGLLGLLAPLVERGSGLPRGAFKGLVDSLESDMTGDPRPIQAILPRPPQLYRQAVQRVLAVEVAAARSRDDDDPPG